MGKPKVSVTGELECDADGFPLIFKMACASPVVSHARKLRNLLTGKPEYVPQLNVWPCGKCAGCLAKRRTEWALRAEREEADFARRGLFSSLLTLTLKPEAYAEHGDAPNLRWIQLFLKRLRKAYGQPLRYLATSERGDNGTQRVHYHLQMFGLDPFQAKQLVERCWPFGFVDIRLDKRPGYVTKYLGKQWANGEKHLFLMSRRPGIGAAWADAWADRPELKAWVARFGDVPGALEQGKPGGVMRKKPLGSYNRARIRKACGLPNRTNGPIDIAGKNQRREELERIERKHLNLAQVVKDQKRVDDAIAREKGPRSTWASLAARYSPRELLAAAPHLDGGVQFVPANPAKHQRSRS